jgi:chromosomal replication initiation ATPase DnaA
MYYTKEEIEIAIDKASKAISDKSKEVTKFTYGYNDCFALLVEYDKALRGKENTKLNEFFKTFGAYKMKPKNYFQQP